MEFSIDDGLIGPLRPIVDQSTGRSAVLALALLLPNMAKVKGDLLRYRP